MHCNQQRILDRVNRLQLRSLEHDASTARHASRQSQAGPKSEVAVSVAAPLTSDLPEQESKVELSKTQRPQNPCAGKEHPIISSLPDDASPEVRGDLDHIQAIKSLLNNLNRITPSPESLAINGIGQAESVFEVFLSAISTALHDGLSPKQYFESPSTSYKLPLLCYIIAYSWISQWNVNLLKQSLATGRLCLDYGADLHQMAAGSGETPLTVFLYDHISMAKLRWSSQSSEAGLLLQSQWMDLFLEFGLDVTNGPVTQGILKSVRSSSSLVILTLCIFEGLSINAQNSRTGQTMMHHLCQRMLDPPPCFRSSNNVDFQGKEELRFLRLLLANGASLTLKDYSGYTPEILAREFDAWWNKEDSRTRFKRTPEYKQNLKQFMKLLQPKL